MQIDQLIQGIEAKFKQSRLVFWYDPDKNFTEELPQLVMDEVTIIDMALQSVLEIKKRIELDEPEQHFLLYFSESEPEPEKDWLLDVRLYSDQFYADHSSMLLNDLGIATMSLREHISKRSVFFDSKKRIAGLKKWLTENENEDSLDLKMIAVTVNADSASVGDILLSLVKQYAGALEVEPESASPQFLTSLSKFNLLPAFWALLSKHYAYDPEEPVFADFILKLFCTDLWIQTDTTEREWLQNNVLKTASGRATALAFMVGWRDSRNFSSFYGVISKRFERQLEVGEKYSGCQPEQLLQCHTFKVIEQLIIRGLISQLLKNSEALDRAAFDKMISQRLSSHWCHSATENGREYTAIYQAIQNAELLMHLRSRFKDGFHYDSAAAMYKAYVDKIFQFDQGYRLFNEHALAVVSKGADILRPVGEAIENLYTNWYLNELGLAWDKHLVNENLLKNWKLSDVPLQVNFYKDLVRKRITAKQTKRVFVIISDALRYEIAQELSLSINGERRFKAELSSQLGVLPSYTQLGMAALLPHTKLSYQPPDQSKAVGKIVYVDGKSSQGLENRNSILQKVNGIGISSKTVMSWSNQEGRDAVRDAEVVYIYHDTIDATGDKLATEEKTFEACRLAIKELKDLVSRIINRLNGSHVLLTADHGFLFQKKSLSATDKTALKAIPTGTFEAKKRYILGENLPSDEACWKGWIADTASSYSTTEFLLPRGAQRFHFIGGARFVHGGAMLQEICVPVVQVAALRGANITQHEKQAVGVVVATQPIKMVTNIDRIRFIQSDPTGGRFTARQLDIMIVDSDGNEVSSKERVNFDSDSKSMDERSREVNLKLIGADFDRNAAYTLVLMNTETNTRYNQYAITIDLAFQDDFF